GGSGPRYLTTIPVCYSRREGEGPAACVAGARVLLIGGLGRRLGGLLEVGAPHLAGAEAVPVHLHGRKAAVGHRDVSADHGAGGAARVPGRLQNSPARARG